MIALRGYAEASGSAAYGAILSTAILSATAIVLALRTKQGARPRGLALAVVGLVAMACVGPAMAIADVSAASMMFFPLAAALVAFLAGAGRTDAPGVALTMLLATVAACSATMSDVLGVHLSVASAAAGSLRRDVLELAASSQHVLGRAAWIAIGAMGLAAIVLVVESARRAQRSYVARAVALVAVAVCVLALHRASTHSAVRTIEAWTGLPWQHLDGFVLARTPDEVASEPWVVVSADGVIHFGDTTLPSEGVALREAIEAEQRRREEIEREEEEPEWLRESVDDENSGGKRAHYPRHGTSNDDNEPEPRFRSRYWAQPGVVEGCAIGEFALSAAVDARVSVMTLFHLVDATGALTIVGRREDVPDASDEFAALANVAQRDSLGEFGVSTPRGACDPAGHVLLTTVLGAEPVEVLRDYETGAEFTPSQLHERQNEQPNALFILFVRPVEGATVQHLADLALSFYPHEDMRLVLVRELPELPPIAPLPNEVADHARDARVRLGHARHSGGLSSRALEERRSELDLCATSADGGTRSAWRNLRVRANRARSASPNRSNRRGQRCTTPHACMCGGGHRRVDVPGGRPDALDALGHPARAWLLDQLEIDEVELETGYVRRTVVVRLFFFANGLL